ncbi:MAG: hypothetical protein ACTSVU_08270 [Promethearchaeota archaeon]
MLFHFPLKIFLSIKSFGAKLQEIWDRELEISKFKSYQIKIKIVGMMGTKVKRYYYCNICKKNHSIKFPADFAKNRSHFPFIYFYVHKYQGSLKEDPDKIDADIITTLYIDQNLTIREVDVDFGKVGDNIISEGDTQHLVSFLIDQVNDLQEAYDDLMEKYVKLAESCQSSVNIE